MTEPSDDPVAVLDLARAVWPDLPDDARPVWTWDGRYASLRAGDRLHTFKPHFEDARAINEYKPGGATYVPDLGSWAGGARGDRRDAAKRREALARCRAAMGQGR